MSTNQSPAEQEAVKVLAVEADQWVVDQAAALVAAGTHVWVFDPEVTGPVGLVVKGTNQALVVVYPAAHDFETSEAFELLGAPEEV